MSEDTRTRRGAEADKVASALTRPPQAVVGIQDIKAVPVETNRSASFVKEEEEDFERAAKREHVRGLQLDNTHRTVYANRIFWLLCAWFLLLFAVLFLTGFRFRSFVLSDNVLLGLIGGTTANVIGIFLFVVRYLYPKR